MGLINDSRKRAFWSKKKTKNTHTYTYQKDSYIMGWNIDKPSVMKCTKNTWQFSL